MHHPANRMDEVVVVKVFKPILIRVMGIGTTIEVVCRGVLNTVLITLGAEGVLPRG